jgi:hypothetical protein
VQRVRAGLALPFAVCAAFVGLATPALGATVSYGSEPGCSGDEGSGSTCPSVIEIDASPGEANRLVVSRFGKKRLLVRDAGAPLRVKSYGVDYCRPGRGGVLCPSLDINAVLGDGQDSEH